MTNTFTKWLEKLIWLGIFLLPFTPLIVSSSFFFPYITGKAFFFRIIVEVIFVLWLALALINSTYRPKRSPILLGLLGLVAVIILASIFGVNPYHSFWSNFERMEGLITYLHVFAYFVVLATVLRSEKIWRTLLNVSLGVSLVIGFIALNEWLGVKEAGFRADATLGNPIYLAVYALFHFFLAVFLLVRSRLRWQKVILTLVALGELGVVYLSGTRSAILGVVGGIFVALVLLAILEHRRLWLRRWAIGILIAVVLAAGGFWLARSSSFVQANPVLSRLANISLQDTTTRDRLLVWNIGWQGFKEKPLLGWGPENFNIVFNKYYNPNLYGSESWFDRSHNILIDWLVHAGVLGLLAYLGLFFVAIYTLWRKTAWGVLEKSLLTGLLAAYFIHNLFVFDNLVSYLLFFGLLGYLDRESQNELTETGIKPATVSPLLAWSILPLAIALIFVIYFFNARQMLAASDLVQAISYYPESVSDADQDLAARLALFQRVFSRGTMGDGEASEQLMTLTLTLLADPKIKTEQKQELALFTFKELIDQADKSPLDARRQLFLGTFLENVGQAKEGIKHLERASELSPNKQQILFTLGLAYWNAGEKEKALATAKRAYELNPKVTDAQNFYNEMKKTF